MCSPNSSIIRTSKRPRPPISTESPQTEGDFRSRGPYPGRVASAAALAPSARTILIIEDEATIAGAVAARLRSEGFSVEIAADGPVGVERCHDLQPDLVVLDL